MLKTMGCKSNQLEGSLIEENLIKVGFEKVDKISDANIFILNSCTVTHKSDNEAFSILNKAKHDNPNVKTVLTGCIAQVEKENLLQNPNIDLVLGNDEKLKMSNFIDFSKKCFTEDIMSLGNFHDVFLENTQKTRASLKIQDGCDNRCSYCIIPFARGKNRSAKPYFILDQIKIYEKMGFKELVLTGIHIGQWGKDFDAANGEMKNLLHLLKSIEENTSISRYRLGSLNPLEIDDKMLDFLKNSEKFCPHFHLSLQSMCDRTLKSMNRHYSVNQSLELIDKISDMFDLPFIGSDVIAGFSGETEEDFAITTENLNKSKLTQIHTFPYSVRKNTAAESFDGVVDLKTKNKRASIIKQISAQKHDEFLARNLNTVQEVLIEKNIDKRTGLLKGVSRNYINVLIEDSADLELKNTVQNVLITKLEDKVSGKIV